MSIFNFTLPTGERFEVKAPTGMTEDQARAIFDQQVSTGSLVGYKVGDTLSSLTQAAQGLFSARGTSLQSLATASGLLPAGVNLNTITAKLGVNGLPSAAQVSKSLSGALPAINSNFFTTTTTGNEFNAGNLSYEDNAALALAGYQDVAGSALTDIVPEGLTGQSAVPDSLANQSITGIAKAIKGIPTNPISLADLVKQAPALSGIGSMSLTDVTGTLAAANKLIGQDASQISNQLGLGKYGFNVNQLEKLGFVKPGTATSFLNTPITDLLKSPTVWTGKDGISGLGDLLGNASWQDKAQQDLMTQSMATFEGIGIPADKLGPDTLSGLLTSGAKSIEDTVAGITDAVSSKIDSITNAVNNFDISQVSLSDVGSIVSTVASIFGSSSYAVNFIQAKAEPAVLKERIIVGAVNTVDSATVDAAGDKIVGNDKVPQV